MLSRDIAAGSDGNLWFTEIGPGIIGRMTTSGVVTRFSVPSDKQPQLITPGPGGALWFTEYPDSRIFGKP